MHSGEGSLLQQQQHAVGRMPFVPLPSDLPWGMVWGFPMCPIVSDPGSVPPAASVSAGTGSVGAVGSNAVAASTEAALDAVAANAVPQASVVCAAAADGRGMAQRQQ